MKTQQTMEILGVVNRGEGKKSYWTRIGTAYRNRDGSLNLRFNYLPADLASTTIQVREPRAKDEADGAEAVAGAWDPNGPGGLRVARSRFHPLEERSWSEKRK